MDKAKLKVLYIAGSGRSGTTLLARLLGELPGFVNVGEAARFLFDGPMQARKAPCGCGQAVHECPFWKDKVRAVPAELLEEGADIVRMRKSVSLLMASRGAQAPQEYRPMVQALAKVYKEVALESGCRVIVDSSKNPANALLVSLAPEIELHVLHVVKNPHSVVASWTRKKGYLATHPAHRVVAWWWSYNLLSEALKLKSQSYQLLRFEDFVRQPGKCLQEIAAAIVGVAPSIDFLKGGEATVHPQHVLAGNPDKLDSGTIRIGDGGNAAPAARSWLVDIATFPLQLRYKYWPVQSGPSLQPAAKVLSAESK